MLIKVLEKCGQMKRIMCVLVLLGAVAALSVYDVEGLWQQVAPMEVYAVVGKLRINSNTRAGIATFNGTVSKGGKHLRLFIESDIKTATAKMIMGRVQLASIDDKALQLDQSCFMTADFSADSQKVEYLVRLKMPNVSDNEIKLHSYSP